LVANGEVAISITIRYSFFIRCVVDIGYNETWDDFHTPGGIITVRFDLFIYWLIFILFYFFFFFFFLLLLTSI
jgi:hypothetical protein